MILTFTYGIKLQKKFIDIIENMYEKDHDIYKLYHGLSYLGVPLTDEHPYFTSSEIWFDEMGLCQFSPDVRKLKIKVKKKTIESYNELYEWHKNILIDNIHEKDVLEDLLNYINLKPKIIFSLSND